MVAFRKPSVTYAYNVAAELAALRAWRDHKLGRQLAPRTDTNRLIATWNIANLGVQQRRPDDYRLIAEIISWFDLVAVQEVTDNLDGLRAIMQHLPGWAMLCSDTGGNNERAAFLYRVGRITLAEKVGEVAVPVGAREDIKLEGIDVPFCGFDRNPYLAAFRAGNITFVLVNVHLFFGSDKDEDVKRRALEAYAVGRWADLRRKSKNAYTKHIICLGDFNLPSRNETDAVYTALRARGLYLPEYGTTVPEHADVPENSNISDDHPFDQLAVVPGMKNRLSRPRPFDYDGAVFKDLYDTHGQTVFRAYLRYYLSDHRPVWTKLDVS
ncbi:MAG: endonuclease/exonuclease/phosphatase family protein [Nitrospirae bacterium]|nr:endonuclease/exonuclease/phosphatase family protein [Nitrospirota bacterium]